MKGYLKFMVLAELTAESLSGYAIQKKLGELLGKKPSAGSLYPLLEELNNSKIVQFKEVGRSKIYSLTKKGKNLYKDILEEKRSHIHRNIKLVGMLCPSSSKNLLSHFNKMECGFCNHKCIKAFANLLSSIKAQISKKNFSKRIDSFVKIINDASNKIRKI